MSPYPTPTSTFAPRFPTSRVRNAALSKEDGEADFVIVKRLPSVSGFQEREYRGSADLQHIIVRTERLDSALPEGYVPDFVKVDVEGAELQVFEGALETSAPPPDGVVRARCRRRRPLRHPADVYALLVDEAGLRIFDADGRGPYSRLNSEPSSPSRCGVSSPVPSEKAGAPCGPQ
jgi:methyltransferase FkbM-like protein